MLLVKPAPDRVKISPLLAVLGDTESTENVYKANATEQLLSHVAVILFVDTWICGWTSNVRKCSAGRPEEAGVLNVSGGNSSGMLAV